MDSYRYGIVLFMCYFWWWLVLRGSKDVLGLVWLLDILVSTKNSFQNFKPPSYMTTSIRHLNTKFADDPIDPTQLIASRVRQRIDFGYFLVKNGFYNVIVIISSHFFAFSGTYNLLFMTRHNSAKCGLDLKRGSRFPKE